MFFDRMVWLIMGVLCAVLGGFWLAGGGAVWVGVVLLVAGAVGTFLGMGWW